jgi:hypothetical protein
MDKDNPATGKSASEEIDAMIDDLTDWKGETISQVRSLIKEADPDVVEDVKWKKPSNPEGVPVWYHDGIICTAQPLKEKVKVTFAKGASMEDPEGLFNASLDAKVWRAIDIYEGDELDELAFKSLVETAVGVIQS